MGHKPKRIFNLKPGKLRTIGIIIGALVIAVVAGILVRILQTNIAEPSGPVDKTMQSTGGTPTLPKSVTQSRTLAAQGNNSQAKQRLDQALKSNPNNDDKYELYTQEGVNALNQSDYTSALGFFRQAEAIRADYRITLLIADTAVAQGNKQLAKQYYAKAIPMIDPNDSRKDDEKQSIENKLNRLGT